MRTYCIAQRTLFNALCSPKWREILKRVDIGIHAADSVCCTAETNTTFKAAILQQNKV